MFVYQRKLFGIATALTGAVAGLPRVITPAASAALQKLAALPPVAGVSVAERIIEQTSEVVGTLADDTAHATASVVQAADPLPVVDDIIEQTNELVEKMAADAEQALEAPTVAASSDAETDAAAAPIAELNPVAAAAGHQPPQASAAPFTVASSDSPIEVEQVAPAAPVNVAKPAGRPRKK